MANLALIFLGILIILYSVTDRICNCVERVLSIKYTCRSGGMNDFLEEFRKNLTKNRGQN